MYHFFPAYPTPQHEQAAQSVVQFFAIQPDVDAVLLMCSCARGKASRDSCLDMCVLLPSDLAQPRRREVETAWENYCADDAACQAVLRAGKYSQVDLEFSDGHFAPGDHGWTSGPDEFELAVGNTLAYSVALWEQGDRLRRLKGEWLPYYAEDLRRERLDMVRRYCLNNLDHIPLYPTQAVKIEDQQNGDAAEEEIRPEE